MKYLLSALSIILSATISAAQSEISEKIQVHIDSIDYSHNGIKASGEIKTYLKVTITNTSSDTLYFVTEDCQFSVPFVSDNEEIEVSIRPCDRNVPEAQILLPETDLAYPMMPIIIAAETTEETFKIGMRFQPGDPRIWEYDFPNYEGVETIWSNSLAFRRSDFEE